MIEVEGEKNGGPLRRLGAIGVPPPRKTRSDSNDP
jgi:hypothetical protein